MHLGLIGYGNIAHTLMGILANEGAKPSKVTVLCTPDHVGETRARLARDFDGQGQVVAETRALIDAMPDLVVECAGHEGVRQHATAVLRAGIETVIVSIGSLADQPLHEEVLDAARAGSTRFILPAGAIGGIDVLSALKPSGIEAVSYTGRKPPGAWKGTPADKMHDLDALAVETVIFSGNAREAAIQYPKNANVAATLALAGLGFEKTGVRLVADPGVSGNIHEYSVRSAAAEFTVRIEGKPSPDNPKTSVTTVYSVAREIFNRCREQAI